MVKNELLATWTYRRGELIKQRLTQKAGGMALFGAALFAVYRCLAKLREEEIIVTTIKIITQNKTWILLDESRQLTHIKLYRKANKVALIFEGQEKKAKKLRYFTITLPIPPQQLAIAHHIYGYFVQWLAMDALQR